MPRDSNKDADVPEGSDFLKLVWGQEDSCERETDGRLPSMGKKAPACLEQLGTVLSLLDRMASCWWRCREGDHVVEYLCGRVASTGRAALRLMRFGFYDESLVLARGIGEVANLLHLFQLDRSDLEQWKASSRQDRLRRFSPAQVRLRLEALQSSPPISQERYTKPQAHNILGVPVAGAIFQNEGLLVSLNELAVALSLATAFGALLLDLEKSIKRQIVHAAKCLAEAIGGATIAEISDYHQHVLNDRVARRALERVASELRRLQDDRRGQ